MPTSRRRKRRSIPPRSTDVHASHRADLRPNQQRSGDPGQPRDQRVRRMLTTLVSLDPIYVRFDGDEQAYLRVTKLAGSAQATPAAVAA